MSRYSELSPEKSYRLINHGPCLLLVSAYKTKTNVMTVAWAMPVNTEPPVIAVAISSESYTSELISKSKEFVIAVPDVKWLAAVKGAGSISGRKEDKFKLLGIKKRYISNFKTPAIDGIPANIYLKLLQKNIFGDVIVMFGKVYYTETASGMMKKGVIDIERIKTVHHLGGNVFTTPSGFLR